MSSTMISTLVFITQKFNIYLGIPLLILGVSGGLLNIIVFLSLKTFRETSCGFYLTIMSFANIGQLLASLLTRIVITQADQNWVLISEFYCKFRSYLIYICSMISFTCICLATIDQYLATSSNVQWRQRYSNTKLSRYACFISALFWILFYIPALVYFRHVISSTTGQLSCSLINDGYDQFITYGHALILAGFLPIFITVIFGLLAFRNVQQIPHRSVPLVRRQLDKQLTVMVLVQVIFNLVSVGLWCVATIYVLIVTRTPNDSLINAIVQLIRTVSLLIYYAYFACPFYIYICASERFRQQLFFVLFRKRYFQQQIQVQPSIN